MYLCLQWQLSSFKINLKNRTFGLTGHGDGETLPIDPREGPGFQVSQCHQGRTQKFLSILIYCHEMNSKGADCMYHYNNCNHILNCSFIFRIITLFLTVTLNMAFLSHINFICVLITFNFIGFGQFYGAVSTEGDTREILCQGSIQSSHSQ